MGQFAEALRQWTERNTISHERKPLDNSKKDRLFSTNQLGNKIKGWVYCNKEDHKSIQCKAVTDTNKQRKILSEKKLCFICIGEKHRGSECKSEQTCKICNRKHHTSICNKNKRLLLTTNENKASVTHPIVLIKVDGITCVALFDTASGSSYANASLANKLGKESVRRESKKTEMMLYTTTSKIHIFDVKIENLQSNFEFKTGLNTVDKDKLLTAPNPNYKSVLSNYPRLKGVKKDEFQTKAVLTHPYYIRGH